MYLNKGDIELAKKYCQVGGLYVVESVMPKKKGGCCPHGQGHIEGLYNQCMAVSVS